MEASAILHPVLVVALLTIVMMISMLVTWILAMGRLGIDAQQAQATYRLRDLLPRRSSGSPTTTAVF